MNISGYVFSRFTEARKPGVKITIQNKLKDNSLIDVESQKKIVIMDSCFRIDTTDIKGDNSDLKSIGWMPRYTVEDTLKEMSGD